MKENVLIVIDMQNDFVDAALGTPEAVGSVAEVVKAVKNPRYDRIIATMDTHHENYMDTLEGRYLPVVHCVEETEGWKMNPEVEKVLKEREAEIITKPTFGSRTLADSMRISFPAEITLCGLCTDICVVSNALMLRAALPDTEIRVLAKACAGTTPERHNAALEVMKSCQIQVVEE